MARLDPLPNARPTPWRASRLAGVLAGIALVAGCATTGPDRPGAVFDPAAEASESTPPAEDALRVLDPRDVPRVRLPPVTPRTPPRPPSPLGLVLPQVDAGDYRGSASLFLHIAEVSRARYVLEPGGALPHDVADALLGPPSDYPQHVRPYAALVESEQGLLVVDQVPGEAAADLLVEAELAMRSGAFGDARARYEAVNGLEPHLARPWMRRGEAELNLDDVETARASLHHGLALSPIDPLGHALMAEVALRAGDPALARRSISRALALYPDYPPVLPLIEVLTGQPHRWHAFRPPVRIQPRSPEEILVQADAARTDAWLAWALCQAASRFEPDRTLLPFDDGPDGLFIRRELLCAFSLADAATTPARRRQEVDEATRRIARIAEAGYLAEFTLYEIIAPRLPGILLHATPEQHARLVAYVDRFVLPDRLPAVMASGER
jgi:tetratricopeptide (TPR) repeat protein